MNTSTHQKEILLVANAGFFSKNWVKRNEAEKDKRFTQRLMNKGSMATVRYNPAAIKQERTAILTEPEDITRWKTSCEGREPKPNTDQALR